MRYWVRSGVQKNLSFGFFKDINQLLERLTGRYCASSELLVKSALKPPLAKITGQNSLKVASPFS